MNSYTSLSILGALWIVCMVGVNGCPRTHCHAEYCYNLDTERVQNAHFGSKTAYDIAQDTRSDQFDDTNYVIPSE